jgi:hypothetical protein
MCANVSLRKNFRLFSSKIVKKILIKHKKVIYSKMQNIQGAQSHHLQIRSLEDKIASENPVRFIDAFVEHISQ